MAKAIVQTTNGGKSFSRRRARPFESAPPSRKGKSIESNYEFFPALNSSHSNRTRISVVEVEAEAEDNVLTVANNDEELSEDNANEEHQIADPGNPIGNTVNFCVDTVYTCGTEDFDASAIIQSCCEVDLGDVMVDLFLCDHLGNIVETNTNNPKELEASPGDLEYVEDDALSPGKKGKTAWKKSLKIIPGKRLLRSISLKRKKDFKTEDEEQDVVLIIQGPDGKDLVATASSDSDDSIFTNLEKTVNLALYAPSLPSPPAPLKSGNASETINGQTGSSLPNEDPKDDADDTPEHTEKTEDSLDVFWSTAMFSEKWNQETCADMGSGDSVGSEILTQEDKCCAMETKTSDSNVIDPGEKDNTSAVESANAGEPKEAQDLMEDKYEVRVGLEMILDENKQRHKKWMKAPWKKVEGMHRVSKSNVTQSPTKSSGPSSSTPQPETKSNVEKVDEVQEESYWKKNYFFVAEEKNVGQLNEDLPDVQLNNDRPDKTGGSQHSSGRAGANELTNEIRIMSEVINQDKSEFTLEDARSKSIMSQRGVNILQRRRLQSALGLTKGQIPTSSGSGSKRLLSLSKKFMIISLLPKRSKRRPSSSDANSDTREKMPIHANIIRVINHAAPVPKTEEKEQATTAAGESAHKHTNADADSDDDTNPLEYSESDTEEEITDKTTNITKVGDGSSTSVMGFQQWAWGIGGNNNKESLTDDVDRELSTPKDDEKSPDGEGTASCTTFGTTRNDTCGKCDDDSFFDGDNHDGWIMNEDQLDSFTEDERKEEEDCVKSTEEGDAEGDVRNVSSVETPTTPKSSTEPQAKEANGKKEENRKQARQQFRLKSDSLSEAQKTFSKNIRKSLSSSIKKMKKSKSKNFSCDVSVSTGMTSDFGGDDSIETILLGSDVEDRNPPSTDSRTSKASRGNRAGKRNSLANSAVAFSKAKQFWKQKTQKETNTRKNCYATESSIITHVVESFLAESEDDSMGSKNDDSLSLDSNTITETKNATHSDLPEMPPLPQEMSLLDDLRDLAANGFLGAYDDDELSLASTSSSQSWVRDDDDTLESMRDNYRLLHVSDVVIRE